MPTQALEEYLETIYKLSQRGVVRPTQVAESMGVSGPTVTATLRRLESRGLVTRSGTDVVLTPEGTAESIEIVRKHRIAERFLVDVLGLDWEAAHEEACLLEHAMSARVVTALERFLDNPDVCPHGHPIPTAEGVVAPEGGTSLADARLGDQVRVLRVAEDGDVLGYLGSRGLRPDAVVEVRERDEVGGLLTLGVDGAEVTLALEIARQVTVD